jgi:hypothetical protein
MWLRNSEYCIGEFVIPIRRENKRYSPHLPGRAEARQEQAYKRTIGVRQKVSGWQNRAAAEKFPAADFPPLFW